MRVSKAKPRLMDRAPSLEFASALGGARALIQSIPSQKGPAKLLPFPLRLPALLEVVRDAGRLALRDWQGILDLPDEQQTDELLYEVLARVTWILDQVGLVVRSGTKLAKEGRLSAKDWPDALVRDVAELVDGFEDLQETLALGLSPKFRKELESARSEAQR
jgi:hypothetical protein